MVCLSFRRDTEDLRLQGGNTERGLMTPGKEASFKGLVVYVQSSGGPGVCRELLTEEPGDGLAFDCGDLVHKQENMKMRRGSSRGGPTKSLRGQQK